MMSLYLKAINGRVHYKYISEAYFWVSPKTQLQAYSLKHTIS